MASQKSQNSNMLLAFLTLLGVIALVAVVGFFMLRKGPEIISLFNRTKFKFFHISILLNLSP